MSRARRRFWSFVVFSLCALTLGVVPLPAARAGCVGPFLAVGAPPRVDAPPPAVRPTLTVGSAALVGGLLFRSGCEDVVSVTGGGCSRRHEEHPDAETPARKIRLTLVSGDRTWTLGTADAGGSAEFYPVTWSVQIPDDVSLGPASLQAGVARLSVVVTR